MEDSERIFTELIRSIEKKRSEVTELIRAQEEAELSGAEELLEQLEQEIADLKRRDTELEQLSHTEDHIHFLQVTSTVWYTERPEKRCVVFRSARTAALFKVERGNANKKLTSTLLFSV